MNNVFPTELLKNRIKELETNFEFENYKFSEDIDFASKLKGFFSYEEFRRSGRTFLLLRVLIEISIENDTPINLYDHHNIFNKRNDIRYIIKDVLDWYSKQGILIRIIDNRQSEQISFKLTDGFNNYTRIRINQYVPKIEKPREFSKLLLII